MTTELEGLEDLLYGSSGRRGIPEGYIPVRTPEGEIVLVPESYIRPRHAPPPPMKLDKSLKEEFAKAVNQALKDYKHLDGRFIFVNVPEGQVIAKVDPAETNVRDQEDLRYIVSKTASEAKGAGSSLAGIEPEFEVYKMAFTPLPFRLFTTADQPYEMEAMATFYHELGHIVAPNAIGTPTMALPENVADIYGILRHIQKYGDDSKAIEVGSWSRALRFVLNGQGDHFTTLSIDAMPKILEKLDVNALTPEQTAVLASRIALQNTPHVDVMANVAHNFRNVLPRIHKTGDLVEGLREIAEVTLASDQAYFTYKIGASALRRFLEGKVTFDHETQIQLFGEVVSKDTGVIRLEGQYWDDVRRRMKERAEQLDREGVLLGMPHLKNPKPAAPANDFAPRPPEPKKKGGWGFGKL